jgi:hypothetical protein
VRASPSPIRAYSGGAGGKHDIDCIAVEELERIRAHADAEGLRMR